MLAAGLSSRMGTWKMMLPWGEGTVLDSALAGALSFCDRIILVTGHRADELATYYQNHPAVDVVYNASYKMGMFSSVRCGVAALRGTRFFLALGDMPEIEGSVYRTLWHCDETTSCLIPGFDSGRGHPVLLPQRAAELIRQAPEALTLKEVMRQLPVKVIPVTEQGIHWDLDTPAQYQQVAEWSRRR